jgi:hypothetical protein
LPIPVTGDSWCNQATQELSEIASINQSINEKKHDILKHMVFKTDGGIPGISTFPH